MTIIYNFLFNKQIKVKLNVSCFPLIKISIQNFPFKSIVRDSMTIIYNFLFNKQIKVKLNVSCFPLIKISIQNFQVEILFQFYYRNKSILSLKKTHYYRFKNELNFQIKITSTVRISILGHKL